MNKTAKKSYLILTKFWENVRILAISEKSDLAMHSALSMVCRLIHFIYARMVNLKLKQTNKFSVAFQEAVLPGKGKRVSQHNYL